MLIKLQSTLNRYLWGSEAWDLTNNGYGVCKVASGDLTGLTFNELLEKNGKTLLGTHVEKFKQFPVLVKEIISQDTLSIQVHPDDTYAMIHENEPGKTECWYFEDCDVDAFIYYGFNRDMTREEVKERIENGSLHEVINKVPVKKGDIFFVEPGTIHAIGKGISLVEVQQNSNVTYRVYDYDRKDAQGNTRELHIEKALDVMNYKRQDVEAGRVKESVVCDYFMMYPMKVDTEIAMVRMPESFFHFVVTEGSGTIKCDGEELIFSKGDSIFVDAGRGLLRITGQCEVIVTCI